MLTTHNTSTKKNAQRYIHNTTLSEHPPISKKTAQPTSVDLTVPPICSSQPRSGTEMLVELYRGAPSRLLKQGANLDRHPTVISPWMK